MATLLFIHQHFPAQFVHLAPALSRHGHAVHAITDQGRGLPGVILHRYHVPETASAPLHPLVRDFDTRVRRAAACAGLMVKLREDGFVPDLVFAHGGWGEPLFVKDVWPATRLVCYPEYYYQPEGGDVGFDPEFPADEMRSRTAVRARNATTLMALEAADHVVTPTRWQADSLPGTYGHKVTVLPDGIDTNAVCPDPGAGLIIVNEDSRSSGGARLILHASDEVVTFASRSLEPYRGFHTFMRALPGILARRPEARAVVMGSEEKGYGHMSPDGRTWKQVMLDEVGDRLDPARVHFTGQLPREQFIRALQVSRCHVYLTYPFVLSWSCLEAMSAGCMVVGSRTAPVEEVIEHGGNGLLVDFIDATGLADTVVGCLEDPGACLAMRRAARETVLQRFDLHGLCLPALVDYVESCLGAGT